MLDEEDHENEKVAEVDLVVDVAERILKAAHTVFALI